MMDLSGLKKYFLSITYRNSTANIFEHLFEQKIGGSFCGKSQDYEIWHSLIFVQASDC